MPLCFGNAPAGYNIPGQDGSPEYWAVRTWMSKIHAHIPLWRLLGRGKFAEGCFNLRGVPRKVRVRESWRAEWLSETSCHWSMRGNDWYFPYSRTSYDISLASDWSRWPSRPIRSLRYIVTCTRIRAPYGMGVTVEWIMSSDNYIHAFQTKCTKRWLLIDNSPPQKS